MSWDSRIQPLLLCRGVRLHPTPNECPGYDTKPSDGEVPVILELWVMRSTPSLPSLPVPLCSGVVASDRVLSMSQTKLNCVCMLNWIAWNRTILTFKLRAYTKLNCLKWNCFCMLNWIIWTIFDIETVLTQNWIVWNRTVLTFNSV